MLVAMSDGQPLADSTTPFFIVGTGRCGSTLLQVMLDCHPSFAVAPETNFFWKYDPVLFAREPLNDADADAYVERVLADGWFEELGLDPDYVRVLVRSGAREAGGIFRGIAQSLAPKPGIRWLGEKTPRHEKFIERIRTVLPDARFIHIHRDPRDVVASLLRQPWWLSSDVLGTAIYCRNVLARQARFERDLGARAYLRVSYESLAGDPRGELQRVCAFFDEPFEEAMLRYDRRDSAGFPEREAVSKSLTQKPIDRSRVGRYRDLLSPRDVRTIERVLGAHIERLGYERDDVLPADRLTWAVGDGLASGSRWCSRQLRSVRRRIGISA